MKAKLEKCFVAPADTFDNVKGKFPIGFKVWNSSNNEGFIFIDSDVYDESGILAGRKLFQPYEKCQFINKRISLYKISETDAIGFMDGINGNDFQHNSIVYILNSKTQIPNPRGIWVNRTNLIAVAIYNAIRHCIEHTWLNHNDQFLTPNYSWQVDTAFQNDCLTYTLFDSKQRISIREGINHWIPFTEQEVNAKTKFDSSFMTKFIAGKLKQEKSDTLFDTQELRTTPLIFSAQAQAVFSAGLALWQYYHQQPNCNVNASLYDIREHFQGRNDTGKMNNKSDDATYMGLIKHLREQLKALQKNIAPKIVEYGFLK